MLKKFFEFETFLGIMTVFFLGMLIYSPQVFFGFAVLFGAGYLIGRGIKHIIE